MQHDVFISYSSADSAFADSTCRHLEERGIKCWIASRDLTPGDTWADVIPDAIDISPIMVLIFTRAAMESEQVKRELGLAADDNKAIVAMKLDGIAPAKAFKFYLKGKHWLDAVTPPAEQHLSSLAETVHNLLVRTTTPKPHDSTNGNDISWSGSPTVFGDPFDSNENSDLDQLGKRLIFAAEQGQLDLIDRVLCLGANPNIANSGGNTALICAAHNGYEEIINSLLSAGAAVDTENQYGDTALTNATWRGHTTIVAKLLAAGADRSKKNRTGDDALSLAKQLPYSHNSRSELIKILTRQESSEAT